jgi:hypothetical protein
MWRSSRQGIPRSVILKTAHFSVAFATRYLRLSEIFVWRLQVCEHARFRRRILLVCQHFRHEADAGYSELSATSLPLSGGLSRTAFPLNGCHFQRSTSVAHRYTSESQWRQDPAPVARHSWQMELRSRARRDRDRPGNGVGRGSRPVSVWLHRREGSFASFFRQSQVPCLPARFSFLHDSVALPCSRANRSRLQSRQERAVFLVSRCSLVK